MLPQLNQIDLQALIKDLYQQETGSNAMQNTNLGMNQNSLFNALNQLQSNQMNQQQQQNAHMIQEKIDLLIKQKQLQMQQQQNQLQDLAALNATLLNCSNLLFNNSNGFIAPNQTQSQIALDIITNLQINNSNLINKPNIFTTNSENSSVLNNSQQTSNNKKNTSQLNQPSFNVSSSAQNAIFQNLQNQVSAQSSKSIMDSCSEISLNCPLTNQTQQKASLSAHLISNSENNINNNNISDRQQKITNQLNTNQNSNASNCGRWTKEEHLRFVKGLGIYGKNWKKVEDYVGTRSGAQIRSHAQKFFNKIQRENSKNSTKQGNGKSGSVLNVSQLQDDQMPPLRNRQQSAQSNFSVDIVSDDGEGENDQQSLDQYQDIIPEQSNQKDTKEWLHYYRLLQQTCQQNLESQKENQSLSAEQVQQMEEQLKKIQIFIQVLSACDNVSQPFDCASPTSQGSPLDKNLPFSFDNLNINSPFLQASSGVQKMNNNQYQSSVVEINNFSLDGNVEEKQGQKTPKSNSKYNNKISSTNSKRVKSGSIFKRQSKTCEQGSSSSEFDSQMNAESFSQSQNNKIYSSQNSKNVERSMDDQQNQDEDEISDQPTNRPNNQSNSAISSIGQNSALSTPENQKNKNNGNCQFGFFNSPNQQNSLIENINLVSDNIDIDSDFNQIKSLSQNNKTNFNSSQKIVSNSIKSPVVLPAASPSQQNNKKIQSFSLSKNNIQNFENIDQEQSTSISSTSSYKLEPSFFTYFVKKYGKYFNDPLCQTPKLSDLVSMNSQFEQDCVIEEPSHNNKSFNFNSKVDNSPSKRFQAAQRAQNFMELEDDCSKNELPIIRRKQSSFSIYQSQNQNNSNCQNNNSIQSQDKNTSPVIGKYQVNSFLNSESEKQQKIINFRKKLKTSDFSQNPFIEQNNQPISNQAK